MQKVDVGRAVIVNALMDLYPDLFPSVAVTATSLREMMDDERVKEIWARFGVKPQIFAVIDELFSSKLDAQDFRESVARGRTLLRKEAKEKQGQQG